MQRGSRGYVVYGFTSESVVSYKCTPYTVRDFKKEIAFYGCEDIYMQTYVTLEARVAALHYMDRD